MTDCVKKCSFPIVGLSVDCLMDCLPTCNPHYEKEGYALVGRAGDELRTFPLALPKDMTPAYATPSEADIEAVAVSKFWLKDRGFEGLCKLPGRTPDGETSFTWYATKKFAGIDRLLIAGDLKAADVHNTMHPAEMELTAAEAVSLRKALDLKEFDIGCMPSACPKEDEAGNFSTGKYRFSNKLPSLERWIDILEKGPVEGVSEDLRTKVLDYLKKAHHFNNKTFDFQETMASQNLINIGIAASLVFFVGYQPIKDMISWWRGRVKFTDFEKVLQGKVKADPEYTIKGRDLEARLAWQLADTHPEDGYRHIIFDAPTGEGKDMIVEKMILMKVKGDAAVPKHFQKAPVERINAAEFQADTKYRGTVADKVAEIAKMARKGPVIVYIPEIDLVFLSGGVSSGDSETVGKLLLDVVEDPKVRHNLIIIGTTSRGRKMLEKFPDLGRRFNWPQVRPFTLSEVAERMVEHVTRQRFVARHGVTVAPEIADAATRLAEAFYRPVTMKGVVMPRLDAIKQLLTTAVRVAQSLRATAMTIDHVVEAMRLRTLMTFDRAEIDAVLKVADMNDIPAARDLAAFLSSHPSHKGASPAAVVEMGRMMLVEWRGLSAAERNGHDLPTADWVNMRLTAMAEGQLSGRPAEGRRPDDKDQDKDKNRGPKSEGCPVIQARGGK